MENRRIPIIIADDEQNICEMLKRLIRFEEIGLELVHVSMDGEDLKEAIVYHCPEIVITDIRMPIIDGLEVIRWCNEHAYKISFVVLSGYHQFEYAYNALKYKVNDYLLKPVNEEELNETLTRIAKKIRDGIDPRDNTVYVESIHEYFMKIASYETKNGRENNKFPSLEAVNREFVLNLQAGIFRFFYLHTDDRRIEKSNDEQVTSVVEKLRNMTEKRLSHCCFESLVMEQKRGIKVFMNYATDRENDLEHELKNLYEEARALADLFSGMHITMCIGKTVKQISDIPSAKKSSWDVLFCRHAIGTNRIIWYEQLSSADLEDKFKDWTGKIRHSWDTLDVEEFRRTVLDIFNVPRTIESAKEYASFIRNINTIVSECRDNFCQKTGMELNDEKYELDRPHLTYYNSLEEYRDAVIEIFGAQLRECAEMVDKKNLKPIRLACSYVEQHYHEPIKLEDVAEVVNLNPAYFSTLFAKKTGQNFAEYVTLFRLKKACDLLAHSDMNINEIADSLGFSDARYFSKLFRKKMGLKPTEYRRIYG